MCCDTRLMLRSRLTEGSESAVHAVASAPRARNSEHRCEKKSCRVYAQECAEERERGRAIKKERMQLRLEEQRRLDRLARHEERERERERQMAISSNAAPSNAAQNQSDFNSDGKECAESRDVGQDIQCAFDCGNALVDTDCREQSVIRCVNACFGHVIYRRVHKHCARKFDKRKLPCPLCNEYKAPTTNFLQKGDPCCSVEYRRIAKRALPSPSHVSTPSSSCNEKPDNEVVNGNESTCTTSCDDSCDGDSVWSLSDSDSRSDSHSESCDEDGEDDIFARKSESNVDDIIDHANVPVKVYSPNSNDDDLSPLFRPILAAQSRKESVKSKGKESKKKDKRMTMHLQDWQALMDVPSSFSSPRRQTASKGSKGSLQRMGNRSHMKGSRKNQMSRVDPAPTLQLGFDSPLHIQHACSVF